MKVFKPNTDCEVELSVFANGQKCPEFALPNTEDDPAAAVCYIPIDDNDTITVQGTFSGSVLYGRIDVLADDAFVADRVIEGPNSKDGILTEFIKRRVDIKTFLHVPDVKDRKHNMRPKVVEGNLFTKRLPAALQASQLDGGDEATGVGVGSLTLIVSLNQSVFETYGHEKKYAYESSSLGTWRDRVAQVKSSDIKPEHELGVDVFPESDPVTDKRATLFWRDFGAHRPGECPWAYLIFYYRTQAAIDAAGCVPLTNTKILPCDKGTFMRASDQIVMPQQHNDSPLPSPTPAAIAVPIAPKSPPAPVPKKAMGLGQPLLLHSGQGLLQRSSSSANKPDEMALRGAASDKAKKVIEYTTTKVEGTMSPVQQAPSQRSSPAPQAPIVAPPRSSFSSSLFSGSLGATQGTSASFANSSADHGVDDLATPSILAGRPPPPRKPKKTTNAPAQPPAKQPPRLTTPTPPMKPSAQTPPPKRPFSPLDQRASASAPSSDTGSPPSAKRPRLEQLAARKAAMEAELQAKREKAVSAQKKIAEARRLREEQQRQWEEEEERRKAAMEAEQMRLDEEAMEAEMEALRQQAEAEDEMMARLEEDEENERREFERMIRAREGGL